MKKRMLIIALTSMSISVLYAQEDAVSSGGEATGANGEVSYSIGQTFYSTSSSSDGSVVN